MCFWFNFEILFFWALSNRMLMQAKFVKLCGALCVGERNAADNDLFLWSDALPRQAICADRIIGLNYCGLTIFVEVEPFFMTMRDAFQCFCRIGAWLWPQNALDPIFRSDKKTDFTPVRVMHFFIKFDRKVDLFNFLFHLQKDLQLKFSPKFNVFDQIYLMLLSNSIILIYLLCGRWKCSKSF